jgi:hypothetical protein
LSIVCHVSGPAAVGYPVAPGERPLVTAEGGPVELAGGAWGRGSLVPSVSGGWRWEPQIDFDSEACRDQDTWSARRGEMDLRLRLAIRMLLVSEGLRITEVGRTRMLGELASTGLTDLVAALAKRYGLEAADLDWQETPEPEGIHNNRLAAYQLVVTAADGRPALLGSLWLTLLAGRESEVGAIVDLCVNFDAIQPTAEPATPAQIPSELHIMPGELVRFLTSGWQAAEALVLATGQKTVDLPPAGASRLELYPEPPS